MSWSWEKYADKKLWGRRSPDDDMVPVLASSIVDTNDNRSGGAGFPMDERSDKAGRQTCLLNTAH